MERRLEEYSSSAWKGGGKNTQVQSGEAEKNTCDQPLRWSCKVKDIVCVLIWKHEVEKAQLEVELMAPKMVQLWRPWVPGSSYEQGNSSRRRKAFRSLKNVWHGLWDY